MKLTPKRAKFVAEYLVDLNATQAAIRAGYAAKSARVEGARLLANAVIAKAVAAGKAAQLQRIEVDGDRVLREVMRIALADISQAFGPDGQLLPLASMPEEIRRAISGIETDELFEGRGDDAVKLGVTRKVRFWDKPKSLELLLRHLGLLKDRMQVEAGPGWAELVEASLKPKGGAP